VLKPYRDGVRERKIILKLQSRTPSLLHDCASLSARLGLTAESRMKIDQLSAPFQGSTSEIYRGQIQVREEIAMEASTFKLKTPQITGGRSHIPLAATESMSVGLNYYTPGRKNKLHTHPGEDHTFVVMEGQATFYNKEHEPTVLNKGEGIMLPENHYYYFQNTGEGPLALLRVSAKKGTKPKVVRVDTEGNRRTEEENEFIVVDGTTVEGKFWELR
jgi:mannose-6-phosphate isomerase-like protein (cupin superfamily)